MRAGLFVALTFGFVWLAACSDAPQPPAAEQTATRIVTLAPNLAELVFAAGAGARLVGVSAWSDYPESVRDLPQVGDAFMIDLERLALLQPDLLLAWKSGTPTHVADELRRAGYRVELIQTRSLADIASALVRIGTLTGHEVEATKAAKAYAEGMRSLAARNQHKVPLSVFYQVSKRPLFTVNGEHYVSELIQLCGGRNVFADLNDLAPTVDVEAVIERDPDVMLASTDAGPEAFDDWQRWPHLAANAYSNQFLMPADEIGRATTRLLMAGDAVCDALDTARQNMDSAKAGQ